jgi:PHD/YefM family antitoxin component YafN of YafNO toxin-antitoxin module
MPLTYNIKEAQAGLPELCRSGERFIIANRNRPVMVAMPVEDFEALLETMDVLADRAAMKGLKSARAGRVQYRDLDLNDENFGL